MKITIPKFGLKEIFLMSSYTIFLVFSLLSTSFYYKYFVDQFKFIILFAVVLLILKELIEKFNLRTIITMMFILVLFMIGFMVSENSIQLLVPTSFLFIFCFRDSQFSSIAKWTVFVSSLVLLFIIVSSQVGIIQNFTVFRSGRLRHYIGFRYALYAPTIMSNITLLIAYLRREDFGLILSGFLFGINYWIFEQTNSRLTFLTSVLVIFLTYLFKFIFSNNQKKWLFSLLIPSFVISFLLSYYLTVWYNSNVHWQFMLNDFLGSRLRLGQQSLHMYGFKLLAQDIQWIGHGLNSEGYATIGSYNYVDSFYIAILQRYGALFMSFFIIIITWLNKKLYDLKEYYLLFILAVLAVHGIIDDLIINLHYNTFWLLFGLLIKSNYKINQLNN